MMRASTDGRNLIKQLEGLRLEAYPDGAGYSIGYGHHGGGVKLGDRITLDDAEALFAADLQRFESAVATGTAGAGIDGTSQGQFDALVSLAYNIGVGAFNQSTLLQRHNERNYAAAAAEFDKWRKSGGVVHPGLVARRNTEEAIYRAGSPAGSAVVNPAPAPELAAAAAPGALIFFLPLLWWALRRPARR